MPNVDLHSHSFASPDAVGYPAAVARHFKEAGFAAFSLTDHYSLDGQEEAREAAAELGIEYVPGVEIGCAVADPQLNMGGGSDILCYYFEPTDEIRRLTDRGDKLRRIRLTLDKIAADGGPAIGMQEYQATLDAGYEKRYHHFLGIQREALCDILISHDFLDPSEASRTGIPLSQWRCARGKGLIRDAVKDLPPTDPLKGGPTIEEVAAAVRAAGGITILAHPCRRRGEPDENERQLINRWLDSYVDGLEIFHPSNTPAYREMLMSIARDRKCPYTGGGDRHNYEPTTGKHSDAPEQCLRMLKDARR